MVAYCELASGHVRRVHNPVKLYSFRQKVLVSVLQEYGKGLENFNQKPLHIADIRLQNLLDFM